MMLFSKNEELNCWETNTVFRGRIIRLAINNCYQESEHLTIARTTLEKIDRAWLDIEENIVRSLHESYNQNWVDPDKGFPQLDTQQFLEKIIFQGVEINNNSLSLYFADSQLFGGHYVDIFWDCDSKMHKATLIG